ncbi:hypothetical protein DXA95_03540 [Odoribacter sp. OF09-27XD]|nr:hypothetical protein DXA95_03540 [Odoribacter sp. OF09-27XD]HBO27948.1 hypothetical protein [Culturomica sp.]
MSYICFEILLNKCNFIRKLQYDEAVVQKYIFPQRGCRFCAGRTGKEGAGMEKKYALLKYT